MLRYVRKGTALDLSRLRDFPDEAKALLLHNTGDARRARGRDRRDDTRKDRISQHVPEWEKDMETGAVLVMEEKSKIRMRREGSKLFIGESPQLIVDLETQENYIRTGDRLIEYHRKVGLSPDLLAGKRANVLETALKAYYMQACETAGRNTDRGGVPC